MKIIFFGDKFLGSDAMAHFKYSNDISLCGIIDDGDPGIFPEIKRISIHDNTIDKDMPVVIAFAENSAAIAAREKLLKSGFSKIYCYNKLPLHSACDEMGIYDSPELIASVPVSSSLIDTSRWGDAVLPQAEMHASDMCNLNCAGCTHFSPLFHEIGCDIEGALEDIKMLRDKFSHVMEFNILGGEPFMNPNIGKLVLGARRLLPDTILTLVSNGLMIPRIPPATLEQIKKANVAISISVYEPTKKVLNAVKRCLRIARIPFMLRIGVNKESFNRPIAIRPDGNYQLACISPNCVNIYHGKIARCPTLMYVPKFNQTFGEHLPEDGIMDLKTCGDGRALLAKLNERVPLCEHCVLNPMEWHTCTMPAKKEDFAV
ncbi:MAG: radical SAM protein [Schwartzia sp.]|nr:radical SAM protein [Schwartzia sp. (in: firmicutes)]